MRERIKIVNSDVGLSVLIQCKFDKFKFVLEFIRITPIPNLFTLEVVQRCQQC